MHPEGLQSSVYTYDTVLTHQNKAAFYFHTYLLCLSACQTGICEYKENQSPNQNTEVQWAEK